MMLMCEQTRTQANVILFLSTTGFHPDRYLHLHFESGADRETFCHENQAGQKATGLEPGAELPRKWQLCHVADLRPHRKLGREKEQADMGWVPMQPTHAYTPTKQFKATLEEATIQTQDQRHCCDSFGRSFDPQENSGRKKLVELATRVRTFTQKRRSTPTAT